MKNIVFPDWLYRMVGRAAEGKDLVTANLRLVWRVANQMLYLGIPFDDLFQLGVIGLIRAAEQYSPDRGDFGPYATICIRRAIMSGAGQYADAGPLPSSVYRDQRLILLARRRFLQEHQFPADDADVSAMTGLSVKRIQDVMKVYAPCEPLDDLLYDDGEETQANILLPDRSTERLIDRHSLHDDLLLALRRFSERDALIVRHLYGLDAEEMTPDEVAARFGLTTARIHQIRQEVLSTLRHLPSIYQYAA